MAIKSWQVMIVFARVVRFIIGRYIALEWSMIWIKSREDFPGFNEVYGEYFPEGPPARSALVSEFLVDIRVEIECIAYKPQ